MNDIMLDLETMGNGPSAAIIAIGAVKFDITTRAIGDEFYAVVSLEESVAQGGVMDPATVMWWMRQSDEARKKFDAPKIEFNVALHSFANFIREGNQREDIKIWGNGAAFDNVILASAYRNAGFQTPWDFWGDRCYRTIKSLHPNVPMPRTGVYHCAVDDAKSQALHLINILNPLPK